jgi:hypothetical protein
MKLADLGLKTKPSTKYFSGGYVAFSVRNNELLYKLFIVHLNRMFDVMGGKITSKEELNKLLTLKTKDDLMEFIQS